MAADSWRWWPGYASWTLVLLIEARLCSRIISGELGGVTMYVPTGVGSNFAGW